MQSSFLKLRCDLLFPHRLGPFMATSFEVTRCYFKRLLDQLTLEFERPNVSFAVLNIVSRSGLQIGNFCLSMLNVPYRFTIRCFEAADLAFGLLDAGFSGGDVRVADLDQASQTFQV